MSTEPVKAILKRKKDYLIRLESQMEAWKKTEVAARKRAREELPSDDETIPSQSQQQLKKGSQQSKRKKQAKRKSIEEEIVAPKLSDYGTPISQLWLTRPVISDFREKQPVVISQIVSSNISTLKPRKMRVVCRIHSFYPQSIADFAVAWCCLCEHTYSPSQLD